MAKTPKSIAQARQNLEASLPLIPERYRQGVANADWKSAAESDAAEANYAAGVNKAATEKLRQRGIQRVSNEEWRQASMDRGAANLGPGLAAAMNKWEERFTPVYQRIVAAQRSLPPKGQDANANIDRRLKPIVAAAQGRR